jgi:hypothetical protein
VIDEVGKPEVPIAAQFFGGDDSLHLRDALLDIAVDDQVVVFRRWLIFSADLAIRQPPLS